VISIDPEKCLREGRCVVICCESHVYAQDMPGEVPKAVDEKECAFCGHCVAVCPGEAITHSGMDMAGFRRVDYASYPTPDQIENFIFSMRTTRHYKKKAVPGEMIDRLIAAGAMAASEHNSQDRCFIVVANPIEIHGLAGKIVAHYGRLIKIMNPAIRLMLRPIMPGMVKYFEGSLPDMKRKVAEYGQECDPVFHGAPCIIAITSKKSNLLGKDTALTSQEAMRILAHSMGLGTCISGYAIGAPAVVVKSLKIPRGQKLQTLFTLGYPVYKFEKIVDRRRPVVANVNI
jgi:nitroreductase/NAD-dependent dihydropyrimidine dehydrogenase PreA subunit